MKTKKLSAKILITIGIISLLSGLGLISMTVYANIQPFGVPLVYLVVKMAAMLLFLPRHKRLSQSTNRYRLQPLWDQELTQTLTL